MTWEYVLAGYIIGMLIYNVVDGFVYGQFSLNAPERMVLAIVWPVVLAVLAVFAILTLFFSIGLKLREVFYDD